MEHIYHITSRRQWLNALKEGLYRGDTLDTEGFIHCSTAAQVVPVANARFRGRSDLVLLKLDPGLLHAELRYEPSEPGQLFPHIYGPLNPNAVVDVLEFESGTDGSFRLPPGSSS
jgi:uncharacterized protein (DUF952 family)